jgi:hypothetical protein
MKSTGLFFTVLLYFLAEHTLIKKSWFPAPVRELLFHSKYSEGDCLTHKKGYWGRSKKRVVGVKFKGEKEFYLLIDQDRRQFITAEPKSHIEYFAQKTSC